MTEQRDGALSGIRVIDVSAAVAGPWTSSWLGDQGADVISVEPVHRPDVMRVTGPVLGDVSGSWVTMNRNKRSIAVDLRTAQGLDLVLRLVDGADVFVQNFRPGVAQRLGVGYDALSARNPKLIYVSVSGFGADGPYAGQPVYDPIVQALAGVVTSQGGTMVKNVMVDKVTAMTAANATLAALVARGRTGRGQHVEVNMLDATLAFNFLDVFWNHTIADAEPVPTYTDWYEPFATSDGQLALAWPTDDKFRQATEHLGHPQLAEDPRFATRAARIRYGAELVEACRPVFAALTTAAALDALRRADVPSGPVKDRDAALADPQVIHNGIVQTHVHPTAGTIRIAGPPARMSDTPTAVRRHAPGFGEHTGEVLAELGLTADDIAALRAAKIVH